MVFKVSKNGAPPQAMKILRKEILDRADQALPSITGKELRALEILGHPNVARLFNSIPLEKTSAPEARAKEAARTAADNSFETHASKPKSANRVLVAYCTTLVSNPRPITDFLVNIDKSVFRARQLESDHGVPDIEVGSRFLIHIISQIASALQHMHDDHIYHCDVKSANILLSATDHPMLTDMGCVL